MGKYQEIGALLKLQLDILQNGKIDPDKSGFFAAQKENIRLKTFYELQDKYTYGWYIAEQSLDDQISSISEFIRYIIKNYEEFSKG